MNHNSHVIMSGGSIRTGRVRLDGNIEHDRDVGDRVQGLCGSSRSLWFVVVKKPIS